MPLPPPAPRAHLHARTIACDGFVREDGQWEIEGRVVDRRTYPFDNEWRGRVEPGTPLHDMAIRITLDDSLTITAVAAATDSSPFALCPDVLPNFQKLVGARIGPGFTRAVREAVGGTAGCTHIVEMLAQIATVAFQTKITAHARALRRRLMDGTARAADDHAQFALAAAGARSPWADAAGEGGHRPPVIDTCYAWAADGDIVRRLMPDHYTGDRTGGASGTGRSGTGRSGTGR